MALPFAVLTALAAFDGGYYAPSWGWTALALVWGTALAVLIRRSVDVGRFEVGWLAAFALLTGWIWLSNVWSESPTLTLLEGQRALAYLAGAVFVVLATPRTAAEGLLGAVATAGAVVAAYAFVRYGIASDESAFGEPVGYSNALAVFAAMAALLALGFALRSRQLSVRVAAAAALVPLGAVITLTASRGAWLALAAGIAVFIALSERRRLAAAAAAALALAGLASLALFARLPETAPRATSLRADLFTLAGHDRGRYWAAALDSLSDHALLGSGAGTFARMWLRYRDANLGVLDAHNLYLEVLSELGPVGLALLLAALAVPLAAAVRSRRAPLVPAAAAAYCTFIVHAGVDWDWEMPVVTLSAVLIGGYLVVSARSAPRTLGAPERAAAFAVALGLGAIAFVGLVANGALTAATVAMDEGRPGDAAADARRADRWALWSAEPSRLLAQALVAQGTLRPARTALSETLRDDPGDVRSWRLLAQYWPQERQRAYAAVARLDPRGPPPWEP
ncbi:MAG TPA: O-antigen ligase family protein [Gaiellaceae bacterium]|nr:O-antigen ligase family protein [Gaiellaceae bacterium]